MHWTEQQYTEYLGRVVTAAASSPAVDLRSEPFKLPANEPGAFARGRLTIPSMNKIEAAYARYLEVLKAAGDVLWYRFEPMKLRLADGSYYKPDFGVLTRDCLFEFHETKGFWREAARVRIKVAAGLFPFKFIAIQRNGDGWVREEFT